MQFSILSRGCAGRRALSISAVVMGVLFLAVGGAAAQGSEHLYRVGFDLDNDPSTGCDMAVAEAGFSGVLPGIETILNLRVDAVNQPPVVLGSDVEECGGGVFGAPIVIDAVGWSVGFDNGVAGADVIEGRLPVAYSGAGPEIGLGFHSRSAGGTQDLVLDNGATFLLNRQPTAAAIPTLDQWGTILLILLMTGAAFGVLRRRHASAKALVLTLLIGLVGAGVAYAVVITLDGNADDWPASERLGDDAVPDATGDDAAAEIVAVWATTAGFNVFVRFDILDLENVAPIADPQSVVTVEDTPLLITLTGSDANADPLTFAVVTPPTNGSLGPVTQVTPTSATLTYTPSLNYVGPDAFDFTVDDGVFASSPATVDLIVTPDNDVPTVDLDGAADDPAGDNDIFTAFTENAGPTAAVDPLNLLVADADSPTLASATIVLSNPFEFDLLGGTTDEVLSVDPLTVSPNTPIVIDGLRNGSTPIDNAPSPATVELQLNGTATLAEYQAALRSIRYQNSSEDPAPTDRLVTFVVNDGVASSAAATSTITVTPINDCPVAADDAVGTDADTVLNGNVLLSNPATADSDFEGDALSVTEVNGNAADVGVEVTLVSGALLTVSGDGGFSYDPNGQFAALGPADTATDNFTYTIDDGSGCGGLAQLSATVTITIAGQNDPPVAVDDAFVFNEDTTLNGASSVLTDNGGGVDSDPDGDPLNVNATPVVAPTDGALTLNTNGSFSYVPNPDFNGPDGFTYELLDGLGGSDTAQVSLSVTAVNDPPSFTGGADQTVDEDAGAQTVSGWATAISPGPADESGQTVSFNVASNSNAALFSTQPAVTSAGELSYTAAANTAGSATISIAAMDDGGMANGGDDTSAGQSFTITVTAINDAPTFTKGADQVVDEDAGAQSVAGWATAISPGPADEAGQIVSINVTGNSNPGLFSAAPAVSSTGTLTFTPTANASGNATITIEAVDDGGTANGGVDTSPSQSFTITVNPVNDLPLGGADTFDTVGNTELVVDTTLPAGRAGISLSTTGGTTPAADGVLDNDSDPIEGSTVSVSGISDGVTACVDVTAPFTDCPTANGGMVTMHSDGTFSFRPAVGDTAASDTFVYRLFDGTDAVDVLVTINRLNRVWFVENNNVSGTDDGTSADPFDTLAEAGAASVSGDTIYVFEGDGTASGQDAGIILKPGQRLVGEGLDLTVPDTVNGVVGPLLFNSAANNRPSLTNSGAVGVSVLATAADHTGVEIRGLAFSGVTNGIDVTASGTFQVGVTISNNAFIDSAAEAIDLNPGASGDFVATVENNIFATASPTGNAFDLVTTAGAGAVEVAFNNNTDITSATGTAVNINGSAGTDTLYITGFANNTVHGNTAGTGISILGATFDADPSDADFDVVAAGTTVVGSPANPVGASGMILGNSGVVANRVNGYLAFDQLDIFNASGTGLIAAGGSGIQIDITTGTVVAGGGPALALDAVTANATFAQVASTSSPSTGLSLAAVDGVVTINDGGTGSSITGAVGTSFLVDGGTAVITWAGDIANTNGRAVEILNRPAGGGNVAFTGAVVDTGAQGVRVESNAAGAFSFNGPVDITNSTATAVTVRTNTGGSTTFGDLDINNSGSSQIGIFATLNGGNHTFNTTTGTVNAGTAAAVDIDATALGVTLVRVDSVGGSAPGLDLLDTTGAFTISGGGAAGAGCDTAPGSCSGGEIGNKSGRAIQLNRATNVSLSGLHVHDTGDDGLLGGGTAGGDFLNGFTFRHSLFESNGNAVDEHGLEFRDLIGTAIFENVRVTGSHEDAVRLFNDSGSLTALTMTGCEFDTNDPAQGGSGLNLEALAGAVITGVNISGGNFHDLRATGAFLVNNGTGTLGATIQSCTFRDNNIAIDVSAGPFNNTTTFNVLNNTVTGHISHAMNFFSADTAGNTSTNSFGGTISGNVIGDGATAGSGSAFGNGIRVNINDPADAAVAITDNLVRNIEFGRGIEVIGRLGAGNTGLTITDNTISNPGASALAGLYIESNDLHTVCAEISGNTVAGGPYFASPPFGANGGDALFLEGNLGGSSTQQHEGAAANAVANFLAGNTAVNGVVNEIDQDGNAATNITMVVAGTCDAP